MDLRLASSGLEHRVVRNSCCINHPTERVAVAQFVALVTGMPVSRLPLPGSLLDLYANAGSEMVQPSMFQEGFTLKASSVHSKSFWIEKIFEGFWGVRLGIQAQRRSQVSDISKPEQHLHECPFQCVRRSLRPHRHSKRREHRHSLRVRPKNHHCQHATHQIGRHGNVPQSRTAMRSTQRCTIGVVRWREPCKMPGMFQRCQAKTSPTKVPFGGKNLSFHHLRQVWLDGSLKAWEHYVPVAEAGRKWEKSLSFDVAFVLAKTS